MSLHRHIAVVGNATISLRSTGCARRIAPCVSAQTRCGIRAEIPKTTKEALRAIGNMEKTAKQELVRRCADLLGRERLAARLGISTVLLDAWIRGEIAMPNGQLLPLATSLNQLAAQEPDAAAQRLVKDRKAGC